MAELSRPSDAAADQAARPQVAVPARRLDIISHRNIFFLISLIIIIPGILSMVTRGFLLGIDFQGGSEFFISFPHNPPTLAAVEAAVRRAWPAIRDSNTATLITSLILFFASTGSVKGFALTLAIGVAISLVSSIIVTHNLLAIVLNFGWARTGSMLGVARGRA